MKASAGFPAQLNAPSSKVTSSSGTSQIAAARALIWRITPCAASIAARPVSKAVWLPLVAPVSAMVSVSTTVGVTSPALRPSTSAACIATAVREPPMSTEPVTRLIVPSLLTWIVAAEVWPPCQRKPTATPRPRLGPPSGAL